MKILKPLVFNQGHRISIVVKRQRHFFPVSEILYCQSNRNYTTFYLVNGTEYMASNTLSDVAALLKPFGFEQIHKSLVVNLSCISCISHNSSGLVTLINKEKFKVSRRRKAGLMKTLTKHSQTDNPEIITGELGNRSAG